MCSNEEMKPLACAPMPYDERVSPLTRVFTEEDIKHIRNPNGNVMTKHDQDACDDQTCTKCGGKRLFQWRTSSIAKGMPLPPKGQTYLHIKATIGKQVVTGFEQVPSGQDQDFYEQLGHLMYEKAKSVAEKH